MVVPSGVNSFLFRANHDPQSNANLPVFGPFSVSAPSPFGLWDDPPPLRSASASSRRPSPIRRSSSPLRLHPSNRTRRPSSQFEPFSNANTSQKTTVSSTVKTARASPLSSSQGGRWSLSALGGSYGTIVPSPPSTRGVLSPSAAWLTGGRRSPPGTIEWPSSPWSKTSLYDHASSASKTFLQQSSSAPPVDHRGASGRSAPLGGMTTSTTCRAPAPAAPSSTRVLDGEFHAIMERISLRLERMDINAVKSMLELDAWLDKLYCSEEQPLIRNHHAALLLLSLHDADFQMFFKKAPSRFAPLGELCKGTVLRVRQRRLKQLSARSALVGIAQAVMPESPREWERVGGLNFGDVPTILEKTVFLIAW